jgi:hypothetical protein
MKFQRGNENTVALHQIGRGHLQVLDTRFSVEKSRKMFSKMN